MIRQDVDMLLQALRQPRPEQPMQLALDMKVEDALRRSDPSNYKAPVAPPVEPTYKVAPRDAALTRRHPLSGQPMTEADYQTLMRKLQQPPRN